MKFETVGIKSNKGLFYLSSKTKQDGYDTEFEKDGETYYHKEFPTLQGKLTAIKLRDGKFGKRLCFFLEVEKDELVHVLELNVFQKGNRVDDWAKTFTLFLENLKVGETTEISLNQKVHDKKGYLYKNAFVKQHGEKVNWAFKPKETPSWEQVEDKVTGEKTWDSSKQDKFYFEKIKAIALEEQQTDSATKEKNEPKKEEVKKTVKKKEVEVPAQSSDEQELPF